VLKFTKMHGIGNDYVYLDAVTDPAIADRDDLPALARRMSDRHKGIGSDGLIVIAKPTKQSGLTDAVRMIMFNADGSEGAMCGNGIRCVAKYAVEHALVSINARPLQVETKSGIKSIDFAMDNGRVINVTVDMGEPILDLPRIPVNVEALDEVSDSGGAHRLSIQSVGRRASDPPKVLEGTFVSMGNPHAVFLHPDVNALALETIGPMIETHPAFPDRVNVHFVQCLSRTEVRMRTWERGSGITMACGTGAAAVCVACVLRSRTERSILMHLPGGDLKMEWRTSDHHVYKTGPAEEVFSGEWDDAGR
jgi:diaminopimelate epimerase